MIYILRKIRVNSLIRGCRRYGIGKDLKELKKKNVPKEKALAYFDDFYQTIYGAMWPAIREAMLCERHKYVAVVNNFSETEKIVEKLQLLGAMNVRDLYRVHRENYEERKQRRIEEGLPEKPAKSVEPKDQSKIADKLKAKAEEELQTLLPPEYENAEQFMDKKKSKDRVQDEDYEEEVMKVKKLLDPMQMRPLEEDLKSPKVDENRIVKPSVGLTSTALHEFIPATELKGLDDYILESDQYQYYKDGSDFEIKVEKETTLNFPEHLKIFTFEEGNNSRFPTPRRGPNGNFDYYLMDGGSILPVLALDLKPGDTMLDMCAAPGGKSLVALQTLYPRVLVCNDVKLSRLNDLDGVMHEYLGDLDHWDGRLFLTNQDARAIEDKDIYNKILVDVPCTTDRLNLHTEENNLFKGSRVKERLQLPEIQTEILLQALKIIAPGGTVVYSTCSLSPIQNDGVVQMALKRCYEETQTTMVVKDMYEALGPLRCIYRFGNDFGFKYGNIVVPVRKHNWGPLYFCKIVRVN
ncbi:5-methylcytosine rRNA methyltransferase NSUN4 [Microplitis demolitor]|uniref:5-methylcytosine rRNA methyltransferase NSUN4 n=1 Tax=Microplitis demolitor TaxID=69319 RepID=UPI0004CCFE03|nr:5-methylcytosine rRNA methyltransferase NSUN4 [Microplitis demolitor]